MRLWTHQPTVTLPYSNSLILSRVIFNFPQNKIKKSWRNPPVLQPVTTEDKQSAVRTLANFIKKITLISKNAVGNIENLSRFSIPPEMDAEFLAAEEAYRQTAMTMEERQNRLLSETEDVAEKDKIYLNGLVRGGSEMAEPFTPQQKEMLMQLAYRSGLKNPAVLNKILYGGTLSRKDNTVKFDKKTVMP